MIICISGLSASGKNTVGELVAKELGLSLVKLSFKDEAERRGVSLMEYQKLATGDERYDKEFDRRVVEEASKGNCVVTTWLGSWMVKNATLRVWLDASENVRAKRCAERDRLSFKEALSHLRARDENNRSRYKRYYGIDLDDHSIFDVEIDAESKNPQEIARQIAKLAKSKR